MVTASRGFLEVSFRMKHRPEMDVGLVIVRNWKPSIFCDEIQSYPN